MPTPTIRPRDRVIAALALGAAAVYLHVATHLAHVDSDLAPIWWSARALLEGMNPYVVVGPGGSLYHWPYVQLYPLPAILLLTPFTPLETGPASMLFIGISGACLAYAVARDGYARFPIFLSAGFIWAVNRAQWSPLLTAATLIPALGFLLVVKPTIGLALFLYRPTLIAAVGAIVLLLASLAVWPGWPAAWYPLLVPHAPNMIAPISVLGGPLLLLALLRWRRAEARLLLALALIPQTPLPYETVVLFLVTTTLAEASILAALTWVFSELLVAAVRPDMPTPEKRALAMRLMVLTVYLPTLVMLLRKPNEGDTPELIRAVRERLSRLRRLGSAERAAQPL
jgi:hypothetical protein